ncbi:MAG: hypothetical protein AB1488_11420 [Nitrospirota bacterium]
MRLLLISVTAVLLAGGVVFADEPAIKKYETIEKYGHKIPDVREARILSEESVDLIDKIPGKETLIRTYVGKDGNLIRTYSIKGRIFRYDVDVDRGYPYEYSLIDRDGDGLFETKQDLKGAVSMSGKLREFYFDIERQTPYEYIYIIEREPGSHEWIEKVKGEIIYVPQWVIFRW